MRNWFLKYQNITVYKNKHQFSYLFLSSLCTSKKKVCSAEWAIGQLECSTRTHISPIAVPNIHCRGNDAIKMPEETPYLCWKLKRFCSTRVKYKRKCPWNFSQSAHLLCGRCAEMNDKKNIVKYLLPFILFMACERDFFHHRDMGINLPVFCNIYEPKCQ